jgi:hypothetical protein
MSDGPGFFQRIAAKVAPVWYLRQRNIGTFLESVGLVLDGSADGLMRGMRLGYPYRTDPEGFVALSKDRKIRLYATEPDASKRYRLAHWRQIRRHDGSAYGKFINAQPYFLGVDGKGVLPRMRIVHVDETNSFVSWHTFTGSYDAGGAGVYSIHQDVQPNWNFDGTNRWSRYWAIIYTPGSVLEDPSHWDDGSVWDGGQVWDGVPGSVLADLVAMFLDQTAPHAQLAGVILCHDLAALDPAGTPAAVGDGTTTYPTAGNPWNRLVDPGTGLPVRLASLTWIYDLYH